MNFSIKQLIGGDNKQELNIVSAIKEAIKLKLFDFSMYV